MVSDESCFPFISLYDMDIVISLSEVNLSAVMAWLEAAHKLI